MKIVKRKSKYSINPAFLIIFIWLIFSTSYLISVNYFFVILIHELGHYFVAKKCGYKLSKFSISPYGVSLSYYDQILDEKDEIKIALAGPIINLLTALFVVAFWWVFPVLYSYTYNFVEISLVIALFNLLPAYPLDGGRVFVSSCSAFLKRKTAFKITFYLNIILSCFFFMMFFVFCFINFNPTYLLFGVFLVMGVLDMKFLSSYEKISIFNKKVKNFSKPRFLVVNFDVTVKELLEEVTVNKTTIFVILSDSGKHLFISDNKIMDISLRVDINKKIGELIK